MSTEILACLQSRADERGVVLDAPQRSAACQLQRLHDDLVQPSAILDSRLLRHVLKPRPVLGLYLWGAVGRGKSFLMDAFFSCVPLKHKRRMHFHHFMQEVHDRLAAMKGQSDPLTRLAREFSRQVRLLCLDEFHINDITDAMLMRGLLQGLLDRGVALVVTSNAEPDSLYRNGLQRGQFLPTIALIKQRMEVVRLDGGADYRLGALEQAGIYHTPLDERADQALEAIFLEQAGSEGEKGSRLEVAGRMIKSRRQGGGVAWFEFAELCGGPRSKADYIELAGCFHTLLLSGVPQFDSQSLAQARRFLWLVDEFYDRRVKLVLSAAVPLGRLGPSSLFDGEFERALSRLAEMQSHAYLANIHQPS
ncbi:cell division protein ZapE [Sulfurimicrobium lacus]|uniref:Cell division protein ZapE n=1 Tax=Sulfurimicrobium lacus TaxID=2715678 RepID=A0A6F8VAL9_9PROT|nr:cell division protein ZapE [Sulfurimicrobium lacus]BCB26157.1 cell division protein ZapE [Sulfurimicrobium lacus]